MPGRVERSFCLPAAIYGHERLPGAAKMMSDLLRTPPIQRLRCCSPSSGTTAREVDVFTPHDSARSARCPLITPVQIGMPDHSVRWWCAPLRPVFSRMCIADQSRVIAARQCTMQRRANAHVRLRAGHNNHFPRRRSEFGNNLPRSLSPKGLQFALAAGFSSCFARFRSSALTLARGGVWTAAGGSAGIARRAG